MRMVLFFKTGSGFYSTGGNQVVRKEKKHCTLQIIYSPILTINFSVGIDRLRFGYVDRSSEFVLTYEENESGHSVFPGKQLCTS